MVKVGDLCFVKVRGYSPWPARVNALPNDVVIPRGKLPIFFYGTHEVSFVPEHHIFEYEKYKDSYGVYKPKNIKFNQGMKELVDNPKVLQLRFDKDAIPFLSQFYNFNKKSAETFDYEIVKEKSKEKDSIKPLDYETSTEKFNDITKIISHNLKRKKSKQKELKEILYYETLNKNFNEMKTSFSEIDKEKSKEKDYKISNLPEETKSMCFHEIKKAIFKEKCETLNCKILKLPEEKESMLHEIKEDIFKERCETLNCNILNSPEEKERMHHEIKQEISNEKELIEEFCYKQSSEEKSDLISKDNFDCEIRKCFSKDDESLFEEIKREKHKETKNITILNNEKSAVKSKENKETSDYETEMEKSEKIDIIKSTNPRKRFSSSLQEMEHHFIKRACSVILINCLENHNDISEKKINIKDTEILNNDIVTAVGTNVLSYKGDYVSDAIQIMRVNSQREKGLDSDNKICVKKEKLKYLENNLSENIQSSGRESKEYLDSFKTPLDCIELYSLNRAKAMLLHEKFKAYLLEHSDLNDFIDYPLKSNIKDEKKKVLKRQSFHHLKRKKDSTTAVIKRSDTFIQYTKSSKIIEEENNLRIVSQLSVIDKEIKRSLIVGQENHSRCINLMVKLEALKDLRLIFLCKVPDIVTTMRKCRRYKKNETIRSSATAIYQRFYNIYQRSDIEEKSEGGAELLRRNCTNLKSAQQLLDEIFVADNKGLRCKSMIIPNRVPPSPSSALSHHSSSINTPTMPTDHDSVIAPDHIILHINDLLKNGSLQLIEVYESKKKHYSYFGEVDLRNDLELYKQLGV